MSILLASVLMLYQVPVVPLLGIVVHPGMRHAPCTAVVCHCLDKCTCPHHSHKSGAMDHQGANHSERPSLNPCGSGASGPMFVAPTFDKALFSESEAAQPRVLPTLRFVQTAETLLPMPLHDIFHPPRWA